MSDERLRLVAEVSDGFTGPLGKLETALGRAAKTGTQAGKDLKRDFDGFHGSIGKANTALQGMAPVLSGLGVAGLTAGVSLGAVTAALSGFSKGTQQLAIMSKETGLAVDQLRAFGALGERFGVSAETMQGGVRKFADEMSSLRKRYGETYSSLQAMNLGDLVEKMIASPTMKVALDNFMESVSQIGDPVKRRKVVEMVLGSDQIAAVAGQLTGRYRQVMDEILKAQGTTTDAQVKAAQRFETALSKVRENMDGLRTQALGPLLEELSKLVEKFGSADSMAAFSKQLDEIGKFARTTVQEFEAIVRTYEKFKEFVGLGDPSKNKEFTPLLGGPPGVKQLEGRRDSIEQQRRLLDASPGAPDYQRKRDRMTDELKRVGDELEKLRATGGATAQPSSYGGVTGGGSLIHKAGFGGGGLGGGQAPGLGGFGGPLPTLGGGYGAGGGTSASRGPIGTPSAPLTRGGGSGGGHIPTIPDSVPMSDEERNTLGLIMKHESHGRNVMNYMGKQQGLDPQTAKGYTAQGYYQMLNSNWRRIAPKLGITVPNAMSGSLDEQTRVALHLLRNGGIKNWSNYNPGLRAALARGDRVSAQGGVVLPEISVGPGDYGAYRAGREQRARNGDVPTEEENDADQYQRSRASGPRGLDGQIGVPIGGGRMRMPNGRIRSMTGDQLMSRARDFHAPPAAAPGGKGSLDITLHNFPAATKSKASVDDLFKEVNVSKSRQMDTTSI